jgi:hypothetical protein
MNRSQAALAVLAVLAAALVAYAQDGSWRPTNDSRVQYRWTIDDKVKDNWRCVIAFRWLGPEPANRSYNVKGQVTFEGDRHAGGGHRTHLIYLLFTKQQKETNDDQTGCGRVLTVSINSVQDHW